jgi:uncharacterized protein (UPF0332 family)
LLFELSVVHPFSCTWSAALALLATKQLGTSKHSGAISLFDREFVKTGIFSRDLSRALRIAFERRQTYDYGEIIEIDQETTLETLEKAKSFVAEIEKYLSRCAGCRKQSGNR